MSGDWMVGIAPMIIRNSTVFAALVGLCVPALAASGGKLGTLPIGEYRCALPGDAAGHAWVALEDRNFNIGNSSTYHTAKGSGVYLLTGQRMTFTRGPMKGMKFDRTSSGTLRWIDENGDQSRIRCVHARATR